MGAPESLIPITAFEGMETRPEEHDYSRKHKGHLGDFLLKIWRRSKWIWNALLCTSGYLGKSCFESEGFTEVSLCCQGPMRKKASSYAMELARLQRDSTGNLNTTGSFPVRWKEEPHLNRSSGFNGCYLQFPFKKRFKEWKAQVMTTGTRRAESFKSQTQGGLEDDMAGVQQRLSQHVSLLLSIWLPQAHFPGIIFAHFLPLSYCPAYPKVTPWSFFQASLQLFCEWGLEYMDHHRDGEKH